MIMKKLLAGLLFSVLLLSGCGSQSNDAETAQIDAVVTPQLSDAEIEQQKIKAESDRILAEAQAEYEANHEVELERVDMPQPRVKSESQPLDFSDCRKLQSKTMLSILPNKSLVIMDNSELSTVKICTDDGAVLITCSAPDSAMVTTKTDNTTGCD